MSDQQVTGIQVCNSKGEWVLISTADMWDIVSKLPMTDDDKFIVPGMHLWNEHGGDCIVSGFEVDLDGRLKKLFFAEGGGCEHSHGRLEWYADHNNIKRGSFGARLAAMKNKETV